MYNPDPIKLLIIEDNPGDLILMECHLKTAFENPTLVNLADFNLAKQMLLEESCSFDLIFLDLSLPGLTPDALIDEILSICPNMPIIVMSGFASSRNVEKSFKKSVAAYLIKEDITPAILYSQIINGIAKKKG